MFAGKCNCSIGLIIFDFDYFFTFKFVQQSIIEFILLTNTLIYSILCKIIFLSFTLKYIVMT